MISKSISISNNVNNRIVQYLGTDNKLGKDKITKEESTQEN